METPISPETDIQKHHQYVLLAKRMRLSAIWMLATAIALGLVSKTFWVTVPVIALCLWVILSLTGFAKKIPDSTLWDIHTTIAKHSRVLILISVLVGLHAVANLWRIFNG